MMLLWCCLWREHRAPVDRVPRHCTWTFSWVKESRSIFQWILVSGHCGVFFKMLCASFLIFWDLFFLSYILFEPMFQVLSRIIKGLFSHESRMVRWCQSRFLTIRHYSSLYPFQLECVLVMTAMARLDCGRVWGLRLKNPEIWPRTRTRWCIWPLRRGIPK